MRPYGCADDPGAEEHPLSPDVSRATAWAFASAERLRAVGAGEADGWFYPRYAHPAGRALESAVARLEGADGAVAFASGMAAFHALLFGLCDAGDTVAVAEQVYGGVAALAERDGRRLGLGVVRFDALDPDAAARAIPEGTRLVHLETPTNPLCRVVDVAALAALAHARGALLSVDATFVPPPLQRAIESGADVAMQSATKFLGGHSDALAGVLSSRHEVLERLESFRRRSGGVLSPDVAWLVWRSLPTLELRARAQAASALRLATALREHGPPVARVHHPGIGSMLAVELSGGLAGAVAFYDALRVIRRAVSLGGVESVASIPAHTSHAMLSEAELAAVGIAPGTVRISVGVEPVDELLADVRAALGEPEP